MDREALLSDVARYGWYHTLELGEGVVTPGMFDHRQAVDRYMIPADLTGMRCLDVGTMDGFWAFEMERRGASEVIAADLGAVDDLDWPQHGGPGGADARRDQGGALRARAARAVLEG